MAGEGFDNPFSLKPQEWMRKEMPEFVKEIEKSTGRQGPACPIKKVELVEGLENPDETFAILTRTAALVQHGNEIQGQT